jgi:butyryl-CoA dehydrogenase/short/branched chain acyl-CoA dehydrogenase
MDSGRSTPVIAPSSIRPISQLSEEELLFRDTVRQFAQAEIAPLARAMDD